MCRAPMQLVTPRVVMMAVRMLMMSWMMNFHVSLFIIWKIKINKFKIDLRSTPFTTRPFVSELPMALAAPGVELLSTPVTTRPFSSQLEWRSLLQEFIIKLRASHSPPLWGEGQGWGKQGVMQILFVMDDACWVFTPPQPLPSEGRGMLAPLLAAPGVHN